MTAQQTPIHANLSEGEVLQTLLGMLADMGRPTMTDVIEASGLHNHPAGGEILSQAIRDGLIRLKGDDGDHVWLTRFGHSMREKMQNSAQQDISQTGSVRGKATSIF